MEKHKLPKGWTVHKRGEYLGFHRDAVTVEYLCPHGVGHSNDIHGCDGCCKDVDLSKTERYVTIAGIKESDLKIDK